jgi:hypothetical protein
MAAALGLLLPPSREAVRVYVDELHNTWAFQDHLDHYELPNQKNSAAAHGTGFTTLSSQWKLRNPVKWFLLNGYQLDLRNYSTASPWDIDVPENPFRSTFQVFREMVHGPESQWVQIRRRLILRRGDDGLLTGATPSRYR